MKYAAQISVILGVLALHSSNASHAQSTNQRFFSKSERLSLATSNFLSSACTGSTMASCRGRDTIDFANDCGFTSEIDRNGNDSSRYLVSDLDNLRIRVAEYPNIAKVLGGYNKTFASGMNELSELYEKIKLIANGPGSRNSKARVSTQLFNKADKISKSLAGLIGVDYDGGCGAGDDDSQEFIFIVSPRPKSASYILVSDLNTCKKNVRDAFDPDVCTLWYPMQPKRNMLSGNYVYKVVWDNSKTKTGNIRANGTQTVEFAINE